MEFAHLIGSLVTLAFVIAAAGGMTRALIVVTWEHGFQGNQVSSDEAFRAMISSLKTLYRVFQVRWLATGCSVAVLFVSLVKDADFYASLGFSAIAFAIVGVATPSALRMMRASTLCLVIAMNRK